MDSPLENWNVFDAVINDINSQHLCTMDSPLENWDVFETVIDEIKLNIDLVTCQAKVQEWIFNNPHHTFPRSIKRWRRALLSQFDCKEFSQELVAKLVKNNIITKHGMLKSSGNERKRLRESDSIRESRCKRLKLQKVL